MKNNTHGFVLVGFLIVALLVALLLVMSLKSFDGLGRQMGNSEFENKTYEEIAREAVSNAMPDLDSDAYSYLDK